MNGLGTAVLPPLSLAARRRRVAGVVLRDIGALRRNPPRIFEIIFWPVFDLVLWGYVSLFLQTHRVPAIVAMLLGAVLLWHILQQASNEVSLAFLDDVWSRNLLNVFVAPLTTSEYVTGLVMFSLIKVMLGIAMMAFLAAALYGFGLFTLGLSLVPFMALLLAMGWALALVALSCVLRFGEGAAVIAWTLAFAFQPVAGAFYPINVLPEPLQAIAAAVPVSYVFEGMRAVLAGHGVSWHDLAIAAVLDLAYIAAALWLFARTVHHARAHGRLSRFGE